MKLASIILETVSRDTARTLAGALQNLIDPPPDALSIFEVEPNGAKWRITAYYSNPPQADQLHATLETIIGAPVPQPRLETVPDLNWVAISQAALPPVRAGRFTIHGSHDRDKVPQGPGAILVDAGEAFGTAHHATTYGCLLAIDHLTRKHTYETVLDLGCGSGVLAIAVSRALPDAKILASDIDPSSVDVARDNIKANRASRNIDAITATGLNHPRLRSPASYDLLIANILAGPLIKLAKDIAQAVRPNGHLVLSGLLDDQAREIIANYAAAGFAIENQHPIAGWTTLVLKRR
ncbi:MAG: 50S ribosomal protein L11 methyltransferase [Alphaproteobacteria bacterium]|nr:50S ribosomal protein L11 methyltransferase [Alphaproteobacteria bacterium]